MKNKDEILKKYNEKLSNLKKHNKFYFTDDNPKISDAEYDKIKKEMGSLQGFLQQIDRKQLNT